MNWDPNERPLHQPYREDSERELAWGIRRNAQYTHMGEAEKAEKEIRRAWARKRRRTQ